jgi:DNA-binding NarL/FixJ family response regulator
VVDDFELFRRFICSTLGKRQDLQVICEASDGPEAVQKVGELKPDLILLDIGLPTLNGIEAARKIRKLAPESKIIFVSQESSADLVQEALSLGALGYVWKTSAGSDLLAAVEAVLENRQFVSSGLSGEYFTGESPTASSYQAVLDCAPSSLSTRNSVSGIANSVKPQSIQTTTFGNKKNMRRA